MVTIRQIRPQAGPQTTFMTTPVDIALYGGAAGSGKSFALLMEGARNTNNPDFGGVIFRRLSPQITQEGGLWDTAGDLYPLVGAIPKVGDLQYRFRSGSRITFRHLQHEATKYQWQGSQIPFIGFDELTHFSESQFFYLLSRNRSTCGVRPYVRATTNPDAGSWVKRLIGPWVDRKHPLYPTPSGAVLWMIRVKGVIEWGRSRGEIIERFGPKAKPKSITFVRASIFDNPALLSKDPDYLANLEMQTPVERARLLDGDWDVCNEGLVYPDFGTIVVEPEAWPALLAGSRTGGIDWGFRDPFAALRAIEDVDGVLWIDWEHYESRRTLTELSKILPREPGEECRWWADPAGATQIAELRLADHDIVACTHLGEQPIKSGVAMVTERIRDRTIRVKGTLGSLIDEAGKYRYGDKGPSEKPLDRDNHAMDALRYLIVGRDRFGVVKDRAPEPTAEQLEAREDAERADRDAEEAAYYDPDSDHWWEG